MTGAQVPVLNLRGVSLSGYARGPVGDGRASGVRASERSVLPDIDRPCHPGVVRTPELDDRHLGHEVSYCPVEQRHIVKRRPPSLSETIVFLAAAGAFVVVLGVVLWWVIGG